MTAIAELLEIGNELHARCLIKEAKWQFETATSSGFGQDDMTLSPTHHYTARFFFSRTLLESKEYQRCYNYLDNHEDLDDDDLSLFLLYYARYLAGEKRRFEKESEMTGNDDGVPLNEVANQELPALESALKDLRTEDVFLQYLLAVILDEQGKDDEAAGMFINVIYQLPGFWHAWAGLLRSSSAANVAEVLGAIGITGEPSEVADHPMCSLFLLHLYHRLGALAGCDVAVELLASNAKAAYGDATCIAHIIAQHAFNEQDYARTEQLFGHIAARDPHCLDQHALLSTSLFSHDELPALTKLAHQASLTNPMSAETACVVGNYHSAARRHGQSIKSLVRAVTLDRRCGAAWVLLGHEFIATKRVALAIECYRRALRANQSDWMALKSIGHAYDLLQLSTQAIFFYTEALKVRPSDGVTRAALADAYERLGHDSEAQQHRAMTKGLH
ncbi:Anaphase-promoting complex subunit 8 [Carpediemonas membranifera]|uniref:Anaphase-promoting complex subunit 8 n=1 Tax=Carpediemonas membranifera TaxID=201153 RepID=A0A8J6BUE2_9EUKA|nr:Anaphase-promoting complex subunit 8 [Carpediemonas membranifera]|eukprot:KAG9390261.1 Anaphase-promoting complex subunit 8 [Carpediemonas membranifera]